MQPSRWLHPVMSCVILAGVAVTSVTSGSSMPATRPMPLAIQQRHDPAHIRGRHRDSLWESSNWSGYAVTGGTGSVTMAQGSWIVPAVSCANTSSSQYSSFWVGIDGFNSSTVEQTGTDSDCSRKTPQYYAWFEFYPRGAYLINTSAIGAISPGVLMTATVTYTASTSTYTVTLLNNGSHKSYSTSMKMKAASSSAEWIAEAPSSSGGVLSIANFGTVLFSGSTAHMGGAAGDIFSFIEPACDGSVACSSVVQAVTMVQSNGAGAQPSALDGTGGGFTVSYVAPPPPPPPTRHRR